MSRKELLDWYILLLGQKSRAGRLKHCLRDADEETTDEQFYKYQAEFLLYVDIVKGQWKLFREECKKVGITVQEDCYKADVIEILSETISETDWFKSRFKRDKFGRLTFFILDLLSETLCETNCVQSCNSSNFILGFTKLSNCPPSSNS